MSLQPENNLMPSQTKDRQKIKDYLDAVLVKADQKKVDHVLLNAGAALGKSLKLTRTHWRRISENMEYDLEERFENLLETKSEEDVWFMIEIEKPMFLLIRVPQKSKALDVTKVLSDRTNLSTLGSHLAETYFSYDDISEG